jgi:diaminopropionate ammonia-lyase
MASCDFHISLINNRDSALYPKDLASIMDEAILPFHRSLPGYVETELYSLAGLAEALNVNQIYLKDESTRFSVGAFKSLGASWAIHTFLKNNPGKYTFCTATDGNHGRAVAWSARIFGQKAMVFMPLGSVQSRIKFIRDEGAELVIVEGDYDAAVAMAESAAIKNGYILIQDTSWEGYEDVPRLVTAGYSTKMREIDALFEYPVKPPFDIVFLQSGVGSWAASLAIYLIARFGEHAPKLVLVEPVESDCLLESAKRGVPSTTRKSQKTIMAGLNCGSPSLIAWNILKSTIDVFLSIPDHYSLKAMHHMKYPLGDDPKIETCESGAAGLGALLALMELDELSELRKVLNVNNETRFLVINTEGITDPEVWESC